MSAVYKRIYTKSSLDKLWFFEQTIMPTQFNNYIQDTSENITKLNLGFINYRIAESITLEELIMREEELKEIRPDLHDIVFKSTSEDSTDLSFTTTLDLIKKYNIPIPLNPFSNIYTEIFEFDNWENLITAYTELVVNDETFINNVKNSLVIYNNTLVEEFYIDDVKQDYVGEIN